MDQELSFDRHFAHLLHGGSAVASSVLFYQGQILPSCHWLKLCDILLYHSPFTVTPFLFGIKHPLSKQSKEDESDKQHLLLSPDLATGYESIPKVVYYILLYSILYLGLYLPLATGKRESGQLSKRVMGLKVGRRSRGRPK